MVGGRILFFIFLGLFFVHGVFAECVDINSADLAELDKITWVGPATAQKIIDARPFESVDDLTRVNGIGDAKLADINAQGLACVDGDVEEEDKDEKEEEIEEEVVREDEIARVEEVKEEVFVEKKPEMILLNSGSDYREKELVYESKNSKVLRYAPYVFSLFLLLVIFFLVKDK